jgi:predicted DNA-binding transcriptional regulator YafY
LLVWWTYCLGCVSKLSVADSRLSVAISLGEKMTRNDRLFDLIQTLRSGTLHTAQSMATRHGVSVRTIWRDMAMLAAAGLPVQGERGVGYVLRSSISLPPLLLTADEAEALRAGLSMVASGPDPRLARAARGLTEKIGPVLTDLQPQGG